MSLSLIEELELQVIALRGTGRGHSAGLVQQAIAALKTQPSGLVPDSVDEAASILRNMIDSIGVHGNYSQESTLLFLNQALGCLDEVARLNSSPVSAGEQPISSYQGDPRSPSELSLAGCNCVRFGEGNPHWPCKLHSSVSAGWVDERAAHWFSLVMGCAMDLEQAAISIDDEAAKQIANSGAKHYMKKANEAWQARATISAPSHGEQVRQMVEALELAQGLLRNHGFPESDPLGLGAISRAIKVSKGETL